MDGGRIILHVDMDAFFAAVEERDRPELAHLPVVIGADPRGGRGRGVVSTANYHARRFGIHSAMPISQAYAACPEAVFLTPSFGKYKPASQDVMEVLAEYADVMEQVGMDEAYLDVTERIDGDWGRVSGFCRSLQAAVRRATGLSCSVGAAPNKSTAKIASDQRKPHGVTAVVPHDLAHFLNPLPVRLINGCGPKTAKALHEHDLHTVGDVAAMNPATLSAWLGKHGRWLHDVANGRDDRPVRADRRPAKSRGNERTYRRDVSDHERVRADVKRLTHSLLERSSDGRPFATMTVKVRYSDFSTLTRAHTLSVPIRPASEEAEALAVATALALVDPLLDNRAVRLVGVRLSNFRDDQGQQSLARFGLDQARVPKLDGKIVAP